MKKVIFICSSGGHLSEMLKLEKLFSNYDSILVTEKNQTSQNLKLKIPIKFLKFGTRKHPVPYFFIFANNIIRSLIIFLRFKPDVIITTGAHTCVPMVLIGHFFKKKILFIESIARVHSMSLAGKIIQNKVSKIFVQWPEMLDVYHHCEYHGQLL